MFRAFLTMIFAVAVTACDSQKKVEAVRAVDFDTLSKESYGYLRVQQSEAQEKFDLGSYERYDWDQEKMQLTWSDAGVPKVIADGYQPTKSKQNGADQPATAPKLELGGNPNPKPEPEVRPR